MNNNETKNENRIEAKTEYSIVVSLRSSEKRARAIESERERESKYCTDMKLGSIVQKKNRAPGYDIFAVIFFLFSWNVWQSQHYTIEIRTEKYELRWCFRLFVSFGFKVSVFASKSIFSVFIRFKYSHTMGMAMHSIELIHPTQISIWSDVCFPLLDEIFHEFNTPEK